MIVKNEEENLARCLKSVKDVVDEIIIVDTGSTDKTIEIANSYNSKLFNFEWTNDFSAARNFALSKCNGNWILYLDADEELNPDSIDELISKTNSLTPSAVNCIVKSLGFQSTTSSIIKYPRLFYKHKGVRFSGFIHEQINDSLKENKIPVIDSGIEIIHYGYAVDDERLKHKKKRNLTLLLQSEKTQNKPYDRLKLISTLISLGELEKAETRIYEMIKGQVTDNKSEALALYYLATIKYENNDLNSALEFISKSYPILKDKPELNYLMYLIYFRSDQYTNAIKYLANAIVLNKNLLTKKISFESENILDQIDLYLRAINLYMKLGKNDEAKKIVGELSSYVESEQNTQNKSVLLLLENFLLTFQCTESDADLICKIFSEIHLTTIAEILNNNKDGTLYIKTMSVLLKVFPDSGVLYKNLAINFIDKDVELSIELLKTSLEFESDPSVYIHLISLYISKNDTRQVRECFNQLQSKFSTNKSIRSKINLLKEKLSPLL